MYIGMRDRRRSEPAPSRRPQHINHSQPTTCPANAFSPPKNFSNLPLLAQALLLFPIETEILRLFTGRGFAPFPLPLLPLTGWISTIFHPFNPICEYLVLFLTPTNLHNLSAPQVIEAMRAAVIFFSE